MEKYGDYLKKHIGDYLGYKIYISAGVSYSCPTLKIFGEATEQKLKNSIKRKLNRL